MKIKPYKSVIEIAEEMRDKLGRIGYRMRIRNNEIQITKADGRELSTAEQNLIKEVKFSK